MKGWPGTRSATWLALAGTLAQKPGKSDRFFLLLQLLLFFRRLLANSWALLPFHFSLRQFWSTSFLVGGLAFAFNPIMPYPAAVES